MTKAEWHKAIVKACKEAGTYQRIYDHPIDTLAGLMEKRDDANRQFLETGGNPVYMHTNKAGAENLEINPALRVVLLIEEKALPYWRDLGLTPAGRKKLLGEVSERTGGGLEELLAKLDA